MGPKAEPGTKPEKPEELEAGMTYPTLWILALMAAPSPRMEAELPANLDLDPIRSLVVQHDGRWPPLDTVARDAVWSVTGTQEFRGQDPVLVLLAWTFDPQTWAWQPLIPIRNAELRRELSLPADRREFSLGELGGHAPLREETRKLSRIGDRKMDPLESKVSSINTKLLKLDRILRGEMIRPVPDPDEIGGSWKPVSSLEGKEDPASRAVLAAWEELRKAFVADDGPGFTRAAGTLREALAALPAAHRPAPARIGAELRYNSLRPFRLAWIAQGIGALLAAAALLIRRRWFDGLAVVGLLGGFLVLTYGLSLRWTIAGRIPAANMYESLLFLGWGMGAFAIISMIVVRHRLVPLTASFMGALSLFLADMLPMDPFVRPIPPVLLDTVWMSIHVPVIMVSYSVLALAVLIAHVQIILMAFAPRATELGRKIDAMHYWYVHVGSILLLAGIITGSMWAASSWGRYWGWDPKEVWSLVAFLAYMAILHVRIRREVLPPWAPIAGALFSAAVFCLVLLKLEPVTPLKTLALLGAGVAMIIFVTARGPVATAFKSVLAFWLIIMTYVGVNYVLGTGLHSYGFGTGAVARYFLLVGAVDLGLVGLCALIYRIRSLDAARLSPAAG